MKHYLRMAFILSLHAIVLSCVSMEEIDRKIEKSSQNLRQEMQEGDQAALETIKQTESVARGNKNQLSQLAKVLKDFLNSEIDKLLAHKKVTKSLQRNASSTDFENYLKSQSSIYDERITNLETIKQLLDQMKAAQ